MNATEAGIRFPIVAFTPDVELWRIADLDVFSTCGRQTIKDNLQDGMEIIDSDWRRWIVRSVRPIGREGSLVPWAIGALLHGPQYRIEHALEAGAPATREETLDRICSVIEHRRSDWCLEEEMETFLTPLLTRVRQAATLSEVLEIIGTDDFRSW